MIVGASMHTTECNYHHAYMTMQVTVAIDAAKHCSFVYLSKTVGGGYVHRKLSNTMSMCTILKHVTINCNDASGMPGPRLLCFDAV